MSDEAIPSSGEDTGSILSEWADEDTTEREPDSDPEPEEAKSEAEEKPKAKPAAKPGAKPEPKKDEKPRTYTLKANGRETAVPAEAIEAAANAMGVDPAMLLRGAQMFRAGQESKREAAELAKQAQAMQAKLKADPREALKEMLGPDGIAKLSIEVVREMMEEEELQRTNPQEIERRRAAAEVAKLKAEAEELTKGKQSEEAKAYQARAEEALGKEIQGAIASGNLPKDPYAVKRLASLMMDAMDNGTDADDLSVADFIPLVSDAMQAEHVALFDKLTGEDLIERFPKMAEKVRSAYVKKAKGGRPAAPVRREPAERQPEPRRAPPVGRGIHSALDAFRSGR